MKVSKAYVASATRLSPEHFALFLLTLAAIILVGCSGSHSIVPAGGSQLSATPLQISVGDDPCDRVASLVLDFTAVDLKNDKGAFSALKGPSSVEFMHLLGALQSISLVDAPKGNYSSADLTIASAAISYLDPLTGQMAQQKLTGPWTASVVFSPAMTIDSSSVALNLHLAVGDSVSFDSNGNISFSPKFTPDIFQAGSVGHHGAQYGGIDRVMGRVSSVSGNSFQLAMMQSAQLVTIQTGSSTTFERISGMNGLQAGMVVRVAANMQSDGTLLATNVSAAGRGSKGMAASGLVTSASGSPITQLTIVEQDVSGSGASQDDLGATLIANLDSRASFSMNSSGVDLVGLPFTPEFSSNSVFSGQAVEIVSDSGMMHDTSSSTHQGSASVSEVHLEQQGIRGTVSSHSANGNEATFTLNVASESFFAHLTGATSLMVFQRPDTEIWGPGTISDGASVVVHGLLFGGSDNYKLVASRIVAH